MRLDKFHTSKGDKCEHVLDKNSTVSIFQVKAAHDQFPTPLNYKPTNDFI